MKKESAASAVWIAHGLVMNGGVLHCVEVLSKRELRTAIAGYRLFGLPAAADVLLEATRVSADEAEEAEPRLDLAYAQAVNNDEVLATHIDAAFPADQPFNADLVGEEAVASEIEIFKGASGDAVRLSSVPGKTREQHRAHDRAESALRRLLRHWDAGGQEALVRLLDDPDDAVRVSAACYLAGAAPQRAMPVLEELDNVGGPVGMSAHMTLFVIKTGHFTDPLIRLRGNP